MTITKRRRLECWAAFFLVFTVLAPGVYADDRASLSARRAALSERLPPGSITVLWAAPARTYSMDVTYPYRQDSDFYYLTGQTARPAVYVMVRMRSGYREWLFADGLTPKTNDRPADNLQVLPFASFERAISRLLSGRPLEEDPGRYSGELDDWFRALSEGEATLFVRGGLPRRVTAELADSLRFANTATSQFPGLKLRDVSSTLHEMRRRKSAEEIAALKHSADVAGASIAMGIRHVSAGVPERTVAAAIDAGCRIHGGEGPSFPAIVAAGKSAASPHHDAGTENSAPGHLVLIDAGCSVGYMASDISRTVPADGAFTAEQRQLYELVLDALKSAEQAIRPGVRISDLESALRAALSVRLRSIGLLDSDREADLFEWSYPGMVHFVGIDVHDVGNPLAVLEPGVVLSLEPGVYVTRGASGSRVQTPNVRKTIERFRDANIRIEDTYQVSVDGFRRLSAGTPREVVDVEAWIARIRQSSAP